MIREDDAFKTLLVPAQEGPPFAVEWKIPKDLPYLEGHFPENPIFPAVGILDATIYLLKAVLNQPELYVPHIPVAKFLSPIVPEQTVRIELQRLGERDWQADWKDQEKLLATLRVHL